MLQSKGGTTRSGKGRGLETWLLMVTTELGWKYCHQGKQWGMG